MSARARQHLLGLLLAILVAAPYLPGAFANGFVWLDHYEILEGALIVSDWNEIPAIFTNDRNFAGYHRPLYSLMHSLDRALWGLDPTGFYLTSLCLHVGAALLLHGLLGDLQLPAGAAFAGGLLFGLHPINVTVAGLIHAKADLLVTVLVLASLRLIILGARRKRARLWVAAWVVSTLALLAKELAFGLPPIAAALYVRGRGALGPAARKQALALLGLSAATSAVVLALRLAHSGDSYVSSVSLGARLMTFVAVYVDDWRRLLLPIERQIADTVTLFGARAPVARSLIVMAALSLVILQMKAARRWPRIALWIIGLHLALLPVAQIVPLLHFRADRFLYVPSLCLAAMIAEGSAQLAARSRAIAGVALGVFALAASVTIVGRSRSFHDDASLFLPELERTPDYREGASNLARHYDRAGEHALAKNYWERAFKISAGRLSYLDTEGAILGASHNLLRLGLHGDAYRMLGAFVPQMKLPLQRHHAHYNLGLAALRVGRYRESIEAFEVYLQGAPEDRDAHYFLGRAALSCEDWERAQSAFRAYLETDPPAAGRREVEQLLEHAAADH